MAKVITLSGLDDIMDFATPEALACLEGGGIPVWDDAGNMVCNDGGGAPIAVDPPPPGHDPITWGPVDPSPTKDTTGGWRNALKYIAVVGGGAGLGYFAVSKQVGNVPSALGGGAAALLALLAFQPGGWLNRGAA